MENFTPISASIGGALIGVSAVLLMALNGKIAGISGVLSGTMFAASGDKLWRILFVVGLIAAPVLYGLISGEKPAFELDAGLPLILIGGFLVGFGTRLGSGCTSGHGVCGLSRLSLRSFVSVGLFMGVGMVTVALARSLIGG
ncbi:MAG: YeeE/YedE family protein [Ponticaulis sp.]|nr:YeeE/YedE family protein [Ponticaulis sp.]|tara:strand:- start:1855 stop:2280 length:426 start_codon:yes stop_codon:yes gene_type:complete